jgi:hypothetical protein
MVGIIRNITPRGKLRNLGKFEILGIIPPSAASRAQPHLPSPRSGPFGAGAGQMPDTPLGKLGKSKHIWNN